jgi:hypothetical protein
MSSHRSSSQVSGRARHGLHRTCAACPVMINGGTAGSRPYPRGAEFRVRSSGRHCIGTSSRQSITTLQNWRDGLYAECITGSRVQLTSGTCPIATQLTLLEETRQVGAGPAERQEVYRADMGRAWARPRPGVHHPDRAADRAAELGPVIPSHLRRQQDPDYQGPPPASHSRVTAQRPRRASPRRADHPGACRISTTLEIYTDTDEEAPRDALNRLQGLLDQGDS